MCIQDLSRWGEAFWACVQGRYLDAGAVRGACVALWACSQGHCKSQHLEAAQNHTLPGTKAQCCWPWCCRGATHVVSWGQNEKIRLFSLGVSSDSDCGQKVYICQPQEVSLGLYCWGTPHSSSSSQLWRREFSLGPITAVTTNHCSVSGMIPPGIGKVLLFSP